jgi:capsular exopolysaccharide synthesis family protein
MTIEAFLHLCVTLRRLNKRRLTTLAILSPSRDDGKSTVAFHLAKAMATLQPRVLLVDADMRRPTLHEKAHCPNTVGLSDVLNDTALLQDAVQKIAPGLDILTSGGHRSNPIAQLQVRFETLLHAAQDQYAMVIIDAPAVSAVSDGLLIATHADGTLVVIAKNTDEREARRTIAQMSSLRIDNVIGIVVNKDSVRINDYDEYFAKASGDALPSNAP